MNREIILVLQENITWENITKFFGGDFFLLNDNSTLADELLFSEDTEKRGRAYISCHAGIIVNGNSRTRLTYAEGSIALDGQEMPVREVVLTLMSGRTGDLLQEAAKLSGKYACILENRTYAQRAGDALGGTEFGRFHVREFSTRTVEEALHELIWWHLCGISQASAEFNRHADERLPVRRLRVEIRKMRAVLTMLKNTLLPEAIKWRERLRELTVKLTRLREIDVALSNWRSSALNKKKHSKRGDKFADFLARERKEELARIVPVFVQTRFTPFLLSLMKWILSDPVRENREDILLSKVAGKKLGRWYQDMQAIVKHYPDFSNNEEAHAVRIKAKSVRYVMQSMSGKAYGDDNRVMRNLKRFLDALGMLHDNCINEELARSSMKKGGDAELVYQAGIFTGNERAQTLRLRKILPGLWEKFSADWVKWY